MKPTAEGGKVEVMFRLADPGPDRTLLGEKRWSWQVAGGWREICSACLETQWASGRTECQVTVGQSLPSGSPAGSRPLLQPGHQETSPAMRSLVASIQQPFPGSYTLVFGCVELNSFCNEIYKSYDSFRWWLLPETVAEHNQRRELWRRGRRGRQLEPPLDTRCP